METRGVAGEGGTREFNARSSYLCHRKCESERWHDFLIPVWRHLANCRGCVNSTNFLKCEIINALFDPIGTFSVGVEQEVLSDE